MRRVVISLLALLVMLSLPASVLAQEYYFAVPQETVSVYWNEDGTLTLAYTFVFENQPGAHVIDFVDVGLPNSDYVFSSISADVDGNAVLMSRDYQGSGSGVAVAMSSYAIQPGQRGTVHVRVGTIKNVLYTDSDDETYASAVFSPTWFGSQYVTGNTDLTVTFHLPPGIQPEEPRWHAAPSGFPSEPVTGLDESGRVTYTWNNPSANAHTQYKFGASFPKSYIPESAIQAEPTFQLPSIDFGDDLMGTCFCFIWALAFFGGPVLGVVQSQRRKMKYLPPKISIEGHGIKRGLTAVEAAILMEQPLDKVMTMILFGVIKKDAAEVVTRDPLELKVTEPLPEGLHQYEKDFLGAFRAGANLKQRRLDLQDMTVRLVKSVSEKMKGFSRKETLDYYKGIMERAWDQIAAAGTPEVQSKMFEEALEWTMLDKDYDDRTRRTFTRPIFVPTWWHHYDPGYGRSVSAPRPVSTGAPASSSRSSGLPGADFAASVVGGVQTFSQRVIGNVGDFTNRVTNVTNPIPKSASRSGSWRSGGGGRSCACACACAGCACACAGGGR
ncbi:MAG: hypothetical protein ACOYYU_10245 [Chloroflexota bacterium]